MVVARRRLTLRLEEGLIRRARAVAERRGTSLTDIVARQLEALVEEDERYETDRRLALAALSDATARGGRRWRREDLYRL